MGARVRAVCNVRKTEGFKLIAKAVEGESNWRIDNAALLQGRVVPLLIPVGDGRYGHRYESNSDFFFNHP